MVEEVFDNDEDNFKMLDTCPVCGNPLEDYKCVNKECPERLRLRIINYITALGVKGIGPSVISALISFGHLTCIKGIYEMDAEVIKGLPRQGQSAVDKWKALQSKEITALQFLSAYPFDNIGSSAWKSILEVYPIDRLATMNLEELRESGIKGLGASKYDAIIYQFNDNREDILGTLRILGLL
jgi:NAD-dependent DNA ligase